MHRNDERTVEVYRSSNRLEVDAIAEEVRAAGIICRVDGGEVASAFAGFTALDGVTLIGLAVFESDAERAHEIATRWLRKERSSRQADRA